MLVVGATSKIPKDHAWPDGLSPVLADASRRRFRTRISKRTIENVEAEVERLLLADCEAEEIMYEFHNRKEEGSVMEDDINDDFDDDSVANSSQMFDGDFNMLDAAFDEAIDNEDDVPVDVESEEDSNDDSDPEGPAEIDVDAEERASDEDDGEYNGATALIKRAKELKYEIEDLGKKKLDKSKLLNEQVNPIMKKRFEEIVDKLSAELSNRMEQLEAVEEELERVQAEKDMFFE